MASGPGCVGDPSVQEESPTWSVAISTGNLGRKINGVSLFQVQAVCVQDGRSETMEKGRERGVGKGKRREWELRLGSGREWGKQKPSLKDETHKAEHLPQLTYLCSTPVILFPQPASPIPLVSPIAPASPTALSTPIFPHPTSSRTLLHRSIFTRSSSRPTCHPSAAPLHPPCSIYLHYLSLYLFLSICLHHSAAVILLPTPFLPS